MWPAGQTHDDEVKERIGEGVRRTRAKPVGITTITGYGGVTALLAVLWSDGRVETRAPVALPNGDIPANGAKVAWSPGAWAQPELKPEPVGADNREGASTDGR